MLPPPAPTLEISVESALMIRSCSSSNVFSTNGAAADDERDVGRGAADVAADEVALAERLAEAPARDRPGGRAGEHDPERLLQRLVPGQERRRAVGEVQFAREARRAQALVEAVARNR